MSLPFLNDDANRELVLRIQRAREPEEKRHRARENEIASDFTNRGLSRSGAHLGALRDEKIHHLRQRARIARDELFTIVEGRNIRLTDKDVKAITDFLHQSLIHAAKQLREDLSNLEERFSVPHAVSEGPALEMLLGQAIAHEAGAEVTIRASELRQKQKTRRRAWWLERSEKLFWLIVGVVGTLVTQWVVRRWK